MDQASENKSVLVEPVLSLARRSAAVVEGAMVLMLPVVVVRGTAEVALSEARVLRTGTETLEESLVDVTAGEGPLAPFETEEAAAAEADGAVEADALSFEVIGAVVV